MGVAEYGLTVHPFEMDVPKRAALKPLEEASEVFAAWQALERSNGDPAALTELADEIADVVQAACNLAARYGIDMAAAMERCEERNRKRGRYAQDGWEEGSWTSVPRVCR